MPANKFSNYKILIHHDTCMQHWHNYKLPEIKNDVWIYSNDDLVFCLCILYKGDTPTDNC